MLLHLQEQKQKQNYTVLLQNYSARLLLQRLLVLLLLLLIQVLLLTQVLLLSLTFFNRCSCKTEDLVSTEAPFKQKLPIKVLSGGPAILQKLLLLILLAPAPDFLLLMLLRWNTVSYEMIAVSVGIEWLSALGPAKKNVERLEGRL